MITSENKYTILYVSLAIAGTIAITLSLYLFLQSLGIVGGIEDNTTRLDHIYLYVDGMPCLIWGDIINGKIESLAGIDCNWIEWDGFPRTTIPQGFNP